MATISSRFECRNFVTAKTSSKEPALTDARASSVLFRAPEEVKVTNWSLEDMAYFLQVREYCDKLKCSPIQALEDPDALYSSFAEIVNWVMSRNFVLCEFESPQKLFLT
ncbi:hypothetical protein AXG93_1276s1000 [Marchantia polymorpha subsp. ruderalis]|uniref:Uncharacterized protein n=1 Tax=Marchantia polymorpha subsp. ruderalis TaxID=1480154 RepID=A0A176WI60_MARPO|nr:hypothetical protein AXG93_1276s1000 [Marchantia polymorpha subsp. ruderalis]